MISPSAHLKQRQSSTRPLKPFDIRPPKLLAIVPMADVVAVAKVSSLLSGADSRAKARVSQPRSISKRIWPRIAIMTNRNRMVKCSPSSTTASSSPTMHQPLKGQRFRTPINVARASGPFL